MYFMADARVQHAKAVNLKKNKASRQPFIINGLLTAALLKKDYSILIFQYSSLHMMDYLVLNTFMSMKHFIHTPSL